MNQHVKNLRRDRYRATFGTRVHEVDEENRFTPGERSEEKTEQVVDNSGDQGEGPQQPEEDSNSEGSGEHPPNGIVVDGEKVLHDGDDDDDNGDDGEGNQSSKKDITLPPEDVAEPVDEPDDNGENGEGFYGDEANGVPPDLNYDANDSSWLHKFLNRVQDAEANIPRDHTLPFDKHSKLGISKGEACVDLYEICARHNLKQVVINDVLEWLHLNTQSLNLPISKATLANKDTPDGSLPPFRNNLKAYVGPDDRGCVLDVCKRECMVFHGTQLNKDQVSFISKYVAINAQFNLKYCTGPCRLYEADKMYVLQHAAIQQMHSLRLPGQSI